MIKKFLAVLACAALVMGVTGCSKDNGGNTGSDVTTYKVGVAIYKYDDNFMTLYREELANYFETLETDTVKYDVTVMDGKGDQGEQTNQINNFISGGYDVIIANLVQPTSASVISTAAAEADIPVVYINREPEAADLEAYPGKSTYVGADARQSGTYQGEIIAALPDHGDINGDGKVSYVMLVGDPDNVDAKYRTEFSIKAMEDAGYTMEKLVEQRGDWDTAKGQQITADALSQYGEQVEVVFANNDGMALGAVQALKDANRTVGEDVYLVGVDALPEVVELVNNGGMTGTVLNDHVGQSHAAVDAAIAAINGEELEQYYWVDYVKVVKK
ncbi:MAG: galactose ABC transporter substrate-binding protein [Erysipelotrichales bacterium]|nr:galactose ABC transporter substrate-binding protein [Erysipelotrichales bacterium]